MAQPAKILPIRHRDEPATLFTATVNRRAVPKPPLFTTWLIACVAAYCGAEMLSALINQTREPFLPAYAFELIFGVFAILAMRTNDDGRLIYFQPFWKYTSGRVHPAAPGIAAIVIAAFFASMSALESFTHPASTRERAVPVLIALSCAVACIELADFIRRTTRRDSRGASRGRSKSRDSGRSSRARSR